TVLLAPLRPRLRGHQRVRQRLVLLVPDKPAAALFLHAAAADGTVAVVHGSLAPFFTSSREDRLPRGTRGGDNQGNIQGGVDQRSQGTDRPQRQGVSGSPLRALIRHPSQRGDRFYSIVELARCNQQR